VFGNAQKGGIFELKKQKTSFITVSKSNFLSMKKQSILVIALCWAVAQMAAQVAFKHTAVSPGNISNNWTTLDHSSTNGRADALLFVTSDYGSSGPYHTKAIGVWYNNSRWTIFNQDRSAMAPSAKFNVMVATPSDNAFVHTAAAATISGHITTIDHPRLNNNPSARIMVTQNWGAAGPYNNNPLGVYYTGSRWAIYNQNRAAMPPNAKFNVLISDRIFVVDAAAPSGNWFSFSNPATDNQPNALVFATQYWTSVYNTEEIGVWYNSNRWTVYNQSRNALPRNAKFFVMVPGAAPASVCTTVPGATWFNPLRTGLSTAAVRVNNYTPTIHQFNPTGERAFLRPNDCFFSVNMGGTPFRLPFNLDMVAGGPDNRCKAYINDWNSNRVAVSTSNGKVLVRIDFESNGIELITNCYNNGCCEDNPFCPGAGCPDYELNHAWIEMRLQPILSGGRLIYTSEVLFNVDVRELGNDPCTNNFWAFLCDWGIIPRVGDRQNRIRQAIESNLKAQLDNALLRVAIEGTLNNAISSGGVDISRCSSVAMDASGNLVFRQ